MTVGHIFHISVVDQICAITDHRFGFAFAAHFRQRRPKVRIARPENGVRTQSAGQQTLRRAILSSDEASGGREYGKAMEVGGWAD